MTRQLNLNFAATEQLFLRVAKSDVFAPTKEKPTSKLKPQRVKFQLSVYRASLTSNSSAPLRFFLDGAPGGSKENTST